MKGLNKTWLLALCSITVAVGIMFWFRWLEPTARTETEGYDFLWEKLTVSTVTAFSLLFGFIEPRSPWRWPFLMMYAHYFSGFIIMRHWGQLPPFELIYMALLALPGIGAGYVGARLSKRIHVAT